LLCKGELSQKPAESLPSESTGRLRLRFDRKPFAAIAASPRIIPEAQNANAGQSILLSGIFR
jgi:hypothetical protein